MNRHGACSGLSYRLPSSFLSGEDRGDRQRRVRERDEHLDSAAWFCAGLRMVLASADDRIKIIIFV